MRVRHLVIASAGCEAGNELDPSHSLVGFETPWDATAGFQSAEKYCSQYIDNQASIVNESSRLSEWTSPYTYIVAWLELPQSIDVRDGALESAIQRFIQRRNWDDDEIAKMVRKVGGGGVGEQGWFSLDDARLNEFVQDFFS
jgi:hypothetical protein